MITLSADWIRQSWSDLLAKGRIVLPLSCWDGGDAFTLAEIGPLPSPDRIAGELILDGEPGNTAPVVVRLISPVSQDTSVAFVAPDGKLYAVSGVCQEPKPARELPVQIVEVTSSLAKRRRALLESSLLDGATVCIVGLGTGGIEIALELAKSGVGHFILLDADRLDVGNVARHHAGVSHAGRRKVYAARDLILEKNPSAVVEAIPVNADQASEPIARDAVTKSALIICAADRRPAKLFVNRLAVQAGKTAIYGGAFRRAYGGQILRVRPGESPCYQCFVMVMPENAVDEEVASQGDANEIAYSDTPVAIEPGLSVDIAPIALMVSKLALNELVAGRTEAFRALQRDFAAPWYLWINRAEPDTPYATWPPLSESGEEMTILRWYGISFDREEACPTCGDFSAAVAREHGIEQDDSIEIPEGAFPKFDTEGE